MAGTDFHSQPTSDAMKLTLFDLDHTLLSGDSDVLWCDFLVQRGVLESQTFVARNAEMDAQYRAGTADVHEFSNFYVSPLAGRSMAQWEPLRQQFLADEIRPRIAPDALALLQRHQNAGDLVVLTTAANRFITALTAQLLGIEHLLATEPELEAGRFTGRTTGILNMRQGKVTRLHAWLAGRGQTLAAFDSTAYSDSINDLPLLQTVNHPVAVNPDARLLAQAQQRGWPVLYLRH